jgi:hypothetical protein
MDQTIPLSLQHITENHIKNLCVLIVLSVINFQQCPVLYFQIILRSIPKIGSSICCLFFIWMIRGGAHVTYMASHPSYPCFDVQRFY